VGFDATDPLKTLKISAERRAVFVVIAAANMLQPKTRSAKRI